jgi:hypothetical protein
VPRESVRRVERVEPSHQPVARHLRDDRRGGDRRALRVAVDDRRVLRGRRPEAKAVDEARLGRRRQRVQHCPQPGEVGLVQPVAVDVARRDHAHGHLLRALEHASEQVLAQLLGALLRVVQVRERADPVVAQAPVVEQHAGDDERPRERAAARLVGARDEARAEPAVEAEELLAGRLHGVRR